MSSPSLAELRFYDVEPGRMTDMRSRFHGPLSQLFSRHGIPVAGAWQASYGPRAPRFVYLMHWNGLEERDRAWDAFYADPDWHRARAETNRGSELVERYDLNFLRAIAPVSVTTSTGFAEIELYIPRVRVGAGGPARKWIQEAAKSKLADAGCQLLGAYEYVSGNDLPRVCVFLGWSSSAARSKALPVMETDPFGHAERYLLHVI